MYHTLPHYRKTILLALAWLLLAAGAMAQTWTPRADLDIFPNGVDGMQAFPVGDKIYVGARPGGTEFLEYNTVTDVWTQKAAVPVTGLYRAFGIGFALNGKVYTGLGADTSAAGYKDLWCYDPATNMWSQKANFPGLARTTAGTFTVNGKAYVIGGVTDANTLSYQTWEYDPAADTWTRRANMPGNMGLSFPITFSIGNLGYMTGGDYGMGESENLYAYDPASNTWTQKADFPGMPRQAGVAFVMNNKAYCGLGMSAYDTMFADMYQYNPATDAWTAAGSFTGGARAWTMAATVGNKAYIGTGWDFAMSFYNDWWSSAFTTGVNELQFEQQLVCYPNPTDGLVHFRIPDELAKQGVVNVTNAAGMLVYTQALNGARSVSLGDLPAGLYSVTLTSGDQRYHSQLLLQPR